MAKQPPDLTERDRKFQQYFTALAPSYGHLTSNTTKHVASAALDLVEIPSGPHILIHDNAAGPGTATSALIEKFQTTGKRFHKIFATDYTPAMIEALNFKIANKSEPWSNVTASIENSHALSFEDDIFDLSICNISIANFDHPLLALQEIHHTLKPGGKSIITNWKVFGFAGLIADARTKFFGSSSGGAQPEVAGDEFLREGYIAEVMVDAGFDIEAIETHAVTVVAKEEEDLEGAVDFLTGPFLPMVLTLSEVDNGKWRRCVEEVIEERKSRDGGIVCEAWVVVATK